MTIVIGTGGFVGSALLEEYRKTNPSIPFLDRQREPKVDLQAPEFHRLPYRFPEYKWAVIASAITKIAACEQDKESSYQCNVTGTLLLIQQIRDQGLVPVFLSTDYVFDGVTGGYTEQSPTNPLNEYGRQKALVEKAVVSHPNSLVIRLGKVLGREFRGKTLLSEMVDHLLSGRKIRAAYDQRMSPIFLDDVIRGILILQNLDARGLHHLCGTEIWTRLELAQFIAKRLAVDGRLVESVSLNDLGESFLRPKYTDMQCSRLIQEMGFHPSSVRHHIEQFTPQGVYATTI
jgi:dTDP-4-dehydrorhamnose reductase